LEPEIGSPESRLIGDARIRTRAMTDRFFIDCWTIAE